jgi:hypothetical protein
MGWTSTRGWPSCTSALSAAEDMMTFD